MRFTHCIKKPCILCYCLLNTRLPPLIIILHPESSPVLNSRRCIGRHTQFVLFLFYGLAVFISAFIMYFWRQNNTFLVYRSTSVGRQQTVETTTACAEHTTTRLYSCWFCCVFLYSFFLGKSTSLQGHLGWVGGGWGLLVCGTCTEMCDVFFLFFFFVLQLTCGFRLRPRQRGVN